MNAHLIERAPFLVRAPLLVREIILALLSEAEDHTNPLVGVFGYDQQTYDFIQHATAPSLLRLAHNYVKSNAVTFTVNERLLKTILRDIDNPSTKNISMCRQAIVGDVIFNHRQVIRELVMFLVDSLAEQCVVSQGVVNLSAEVRQVLSSADARKIEWLAAQMIERRCVNFGFDKAKIRERTLSHMRHEYREGIKDLLVIKSAPLIMMRQLFTEENEDTVRARRFRLGAKINGRARSVHAEHYLEFIELWIDNQQLSMLERFLMAHRHFGYGFNVLWGLYTKAEREGEFTKTVLSAAARRQNLACQIKT